MTTRKSIYIIITIMVAALAVGIAKDNLAIAESAMLIGFSLTCLSFISIDMDFSKKARAYSCAMLVVGVSIMFAPIAFIQ